MAKLRFLTAGIALAGFVASLVGCSSDSKVAGNSAETGSPELASVEGLLYLEGLKPASLARVNVIPRDFDVYDDTVYILGSADEKGFYSLKDVKAGKYSLEAFMESGERLLVQDLVVTDSDSVVVASDTLKVPGTALLKVETEAKDGTRGVVTAIGTTIYREVVIENGIVLVDSLPAGNLDLRLILDGDIKLYYDDLKVRTKDTVRVGFESEIAEPDTIEVDSTVTDTVAAIDTLVMRFIAPMALPEGSLDSLVNFVSDIPLALRLTPENCNFEALAGMDGRWEVQRVKLDGSRSKKLPIATGYFDTLAQEAVFWVSIDSLNLDDSLELRFDNTLASGFALDVFPTNRAYTAVWHFDDGLDPVTDGAEKCNFPGTATGVKLADGVVGSGLDMTVDGYVIADGSAKADSTLHSDFVYDVLGLFNFSLWVRLDDLSKEQIIFEKSDKEYGLRFDPEAGFVVDVYHVATEVASDSGAKDTSSYKVSWSSGNEGLVAGEWTYVAFSKHGFSKAGNGQGTLFVNDRKVEAFVKLPWDGKRGSAADFKLGGFAGAVDEFMIGGAYREDSWVYLTYLNQKPVNYWPALVAEK